MKTMKLILLAVAVLSGWPLQAQKVVEKSLETHVKPVFIQKNFRLKQASDHIAIASVPKTKKPTMVKLDLQAQMQKIKDQCPYLLAEKATLQLEGKRSSNSMVNLNWQTTNGWNNDHFVLERSLGDTVHFEAVNTVWAKQVAGIADEYHQPDENTYHKISYYRIKLLLRSAGFLYSNIAEVKGYVTNGIDLYPNPASSRVTLTIVSEVSGSATIRLLDASGKRMQQQTELVVAGYNNHQLEVSSLASGYYMVKVLLPDKTEKTVRFVR